MKRMTQTSRHRAVAGFTLIEIMIVVGIIALIAGIVATTVFGEGDRAKARLASTQMQMIAAKIESFEMDVGNPPQSLDDLVRSPSGSRGWLGPYARENDLRDPWNRPFQYRTPGRNGNKFDLISNGADGKPGGDSVNAEIVHEG